MSATGEKCPSRPMRWVEKTITEPVGRSSWRTKVVRVHEVVPRFGPGELDHETLLRIYNLVPDEDGAFVSVMSRMIRKQAQIRSVLLGDGNGVDPELAELIHKAADEVLGADSGFPGAR